MIDFRKECVFMSKDYPVGYCCSYRVGSGETVEDFLQCIDREAALEKAKDDVKNKEWCEDIFITDNEENIQFTPDNFGEVSGKLEVTVKPFGITHSHHIDNFLNIPLGQIDHANHEVFLECYKELAALWNTDPTIKNAFIVMAEKEYDNIADFMAEHCNFSEQWAAILQKHYGDYNALDENIMLWCQRYFGGFYRRDFTQNDMTRSAENTDEVPF